MQFVVPVAHNFNTEPVFEYEPIPVVSKSVGPESAMLPVPGPVQFPVTSKIPLLSVPVNSVPVQ